MKYTVYIPVYTKPLQFKHIVCLAGYNKVFFKIRGHVMTRDVTCRRRHRDLGARGSQS